MSKSLKRGLKILLCLLLALILIAGGYVAYVFMDYYRLEDNLPLEIQVSHSLSRQAKAGESYELTAWNIGFGAYTDQYSFFMDGGEYSRGFSEEAVMQNMDAICKKLAVYDSDFYLIQEVDVDSTRAYHIDQSAMVADALTENRTRSWTFAQNYDSPYLFYPFTEPHGKSLAGLMTFSNYDMTSALRRSLPIQTDVAKVLDLDRCYATHRIPVDNGKELVLINLHLSAYTTDPTISNQQLEMLYADITAEYVKGNYVVCGGDFNKDLLQDSAAIFGVSGEEFSWAQPLPLDAIPEGVTLVAPLDEANPAASCRNADRPWDPATNFQVTVDGFLVTDNVIVEDSCVVDEQFACSDHNPVQLTFRLQ